MEETIMEWVQTLGISVVLCLLMAYFVKYMFDKFVDLLKNEQEAHKTEAKATNDAINNNTAALTKLSTLLEQGEKE